MSLTTYLLCAQLLAIEAYNPLLIVVPQDPTSQGMLEMMNTSSGFIYDPSSTSDPLTWNFRWPLVEMTSDRVKSEVYLVTYPTSSSYPALYRTNSDLEVINSWLTTPFSFFDLQYSPNKDTLFGIKVTDTYERTLSNFVLSDTDVSAYELFNLPEYWYVNASTYNTTGDVYFALVNNFPSLPDHSDNQLLVTADFSKTVVGSSSVLPTTAVLNITGFDGQVQFLSYSSEVDKLFAAGVDADSQLALIRTLDPETGVAGPIIFAMGLTEAIGPLVKLDGFGTSPSGKEVLNFAFFTKCQGYDYWTTWTLSYYTKTRMMSGVQVSDLPTSQFATFAAAVAGF